MNRQMFVRMATAVLRQMGDGAAVQKAEAIAGQMDIFAAAMGEDAPSVPTAPAPAPAFPAPNPQAVLVAPAQPESEPESPMPSLIIPATTIPDRAEIARVAEQSALRSLRPKGGDRGGGQAGAAGRMRVEELSALIQQRTPPTITFDVPMEDGRKIQQVWERNVVSMHANDSVKLLYSPPNTRQTLREAVESEVTIHVDDLPVDLTAVLAKLTEQAIEAVRPKAAPRQVPVRAFGGPVQSTGVYEDGALAKANGADLAGPLAVLGSLPDLSQ